MDPPGKRTRVDDYYSASKKNGPPKATFSTPLRGGDDEEPESTQEDCHRLPSLSIGRGEDCDVQLSGDEGLVLRARNKSVFVRRGEVWEELPAGEETRIEEQQRWGLLRKSNRYRVRSVPPLCKVGSGSGSFDAGYSRLLCRVLAEGELQRNRKGVNRTLSKAAFTLDIDLEPPSPLAPPEDPAFETLGLVPLTTLRFLAAKPGLVEALWYLRGEATIDFLRRHKCRFWDAQASVDGVVGLNYGLLTRWPQAEGGRLNPLEKDVITPLCKRRGEPSRNLIVSLVHPSQATVQPACTSSAQFSVRGGSLDLALQQRSSDVILGLPHDAYVWSVILHLVAREVRRRTDGEVALSAGRLSIHLPAGSAHAYAVNEDALRELSRRAPKGGVAPRVLLRRDAPGLFELAALDDSPAMLRVEGYDDSCCHPRIVVAQANG
ncbi:hypothetical protein EMIHUDRAFT_229153 [Emiliania huxleyi CCMP1516]|uniref:thymidylate synthase n=4 Tax=Emiliania huxleyi TaxID=2903 RepID=A0A0D3KDL9_EMIH1|nr:hypothetical protein EMIHUDRAFT_229153 [Emiliania huxleyi CCMP1516]EOD33854.1 hypothetical protein EMIHUDRAFT_229153 [Emiliania huxleyi CCMP1516]|eukprot:XP_005786283.1 hypothetical protein EMIHUDRAFT_229153 [Emiliania huxleyi CCMP1516]